MADKFNLKWHSAIIILLCDTVFVTLGGALLTMHVWSKIYKQVGFEYFTDVVNLFYFVLNASLLFILIKVFSVKPSTDFTKPKIKDVGIVMFIAIIFQFIIAPLAYPVEYYKLIFQGISDVELPVLNLSNAVYRKIAFSCLIVPILEEYIYRGIILKGLLANYSATKAIIIVSLVFGINHFNPSFVSQIWLSIIVSYIYLYSGSLVLSIVFHGINSLIVHVLAYLRLSIGDFFFSTTYYALICIGAVVIIILLKMMRERGKFINQ